MSGNEIFSCKYYGSLQYTGCNIYIQSRKTQLQQNTGNIIWELYTQRREGKFVAVCEEWERRDFYYTQEWKLMPLPHSYKIPRKYV